MNQCCVRGVKVEVEAEAEAAEAALKSTASASLNVGRDEDKLRGFMRRHFGRTDCQSLSAKKRKSSSKWIYPAKDSGDLFAGHRVEEFVTEFVQNAIHHALL